MKGAAEKDWGSPEDKGDGFMGVYHSPRKNLWGSGEKGSTRLERGLREGQGEWRCSGRYLARRKTQIHYLRQQVRWGKKQKRSGTLVGEGVLLMLDKERPQRKQRGDPDSESPLDLAPGSRQRRDEQEEEEKENWDRFRNPRKEEERGHWGKEGEEEGKREKRRREQSIVR